MSPIVEYLKLQIRFNAKTRSVELKTSEVTEDPGSIQKAQDFLEGVTSLTFNLHYNSLLIQSLPFIHLFLP